MEDLLILDSMLHVGQFDGRRGIIDLSLDENADVMEELELSFDGTIMAVKKDAVLEFLSEPDVKRVRLGQMIIPKTFKIETKEDFFKYLSFFVSIT
jgi:hypothetical protein